MDIEQSKGEGGEENHLVSVYVFVEEYWRFSTLMTEFGRTDVSHLQKNKYILALAIKHDPKDLKGSLSNSAVDS